MDNSQSRPDVRIAGILEQYERAQLFLRQALTMPDSPDRFRHLIASAYFARAIVQLMLDARKEGELKVGQKDLEQMLETNLPGCSLIRRIRIHDFHRFGLPEQEGMFLSGPIRLTAENGCAVISLTRNGIEETCTGASRIEPKDSPVIAGDKVRDDETETWVPLADLLRDYLAAVPGAIRAFEHLRKV